MFDWSKLTDSDDPAEIDREMSRRYGGCLLIIQTKNLNKYVASYRGSNGKTHTFDTNKYGRIDVAKETDTEVIPFFPPAGIYYIDRVGLMYFSRKPARQWKRGVTETNAKLNVLGGTTEMPISYDTYECLCWPRDFGKPDPLLPTYPVLFNREWAIDQSGVVYFYNTPAAQVVTKTDGSRYLETDPALHQEVFDFFNKRFPKWTIKSKT